MPTYEFQCPDCGTKAEIKAGYTESYVFPWCDKCQIQMKRNYAVPNIAFKGQGFYSTDSKRGQ